MLTTIYIDGFNLYYGALKGTPYKWLDIVKLFSTITNELNPEVKMANEIRMLLEQHFD